MPVPRSRKRDTTLYDLLEVSPDATDAQIAKAYKVAAMKYHPDRNPEAPPEKFKEISAAYDVLKDEHKREVYDQYGLEGLKEGMGAGGTGATSLFDLFMGGPSRHQRQHGPPKGESKVIPLKVTLETLYNGETKSVPFTRRVTCQQCNGSGCKAGKKRVHCRACHGQGVCMGMTRMGPLTFQQPMQCRECDGEGEVIAHKDKCSMCQGNKIAEENKVLDVVILPGCSNGISDQDVSDFFQDCGEIDRVNLLKGNDGRSKGIAFVKFFDEKSMKKAVELSGNELGGRTVQIEKTVPKEQRNSGGDRGGDRQRSERDPNSTTVFVGNLSYNTDQDSLREIFEPCGKIKEVRIATDQDGKPRGFGYVEFSSVDSVDKAIQMTGNKLDGRAIRVDFTNSRKNDGGGNRDRGFGGGRGGRNGGGNRRGGNRY